jgi:hypothetical protein
MASTIPAPSLSVNGWITDSTARFESLLADFFEADGTQTVLFKGTVASLPTLVQEAGSQMAALTYQVQDALTKYLAAYYDGVEIQVSTSNDGALNPSSYVEFTTQISVKENGVSLNYNRLLVTESGLLKQIIKLNNEG